MVKLDHDKRKIFVKTPLTAKDKKLIEDYRDTLKYELEVVDKIRTSNIPKIDKDLIDKVLNKSLKEEFEEYKKIQSIDKETGEPKFKTNKKGEKVPVTIGFRGAIAQLQKNHPEEYKKLAAAAAKA